jgi:GT2 family glycosyltransferase
MDVSIIIVSYNTRQLLHNCLTSIYQKTKEIEFEVIVCDNGSIDGSLEMVEAEFPRVICVKNDVNIGFGPANNKASKIAKGKYLLLLNSDTIILNNAVWLFYNFAEKNKKKLLGCFLRDQYNNIIHSFENHNGLIYMFIRLIYSSFPFLLKMKLLFKRKLLYETSSCKEVKYVTGADIFIEKTLFYKLNGFDEAFFMYFEDDDLCRRAKLFGYASFVIPGPKIIHLEGKSSKNSAKKLMIIERSFLTYNKKYLCQFCFILFKIIFIIYAVLRFSSPLYTLSEKKKLLLNIWT